MAEWIAAAGTLEAWNGWKEGRRGEVCGGSLLWMDGTVSTLHSPPPLGCLANLVGMEGGRPAEATMAAVIRLSPVGRPLSLSLSLSSSLLFFVELNSFALYKGQG